MAPLVELEKDAIASAVKRPELLCDIAEHGSIIAGELGGNPTLVSAKRTCKSRMKVHSTSKALLATRYFGGTYFSYEQSLWIDCISEAFAGSKNPLWDIGRASVLSTASSIVNSIGKQFAQPIRPRKKDGTIKRHLIKQMCRDRTDDVAARFRSWFGKYCSTMQTRNHVVVRGDYKQVLDDLSSTCSVVYADPPYTRDHYSRFYHVLETLCLRDQPDVTAKSLDGTGAASRGIYRADRHQSPFCIKSQAASAFDDLLQRVAHLQVPILLSYSPYVRKGHPRMLAVDKIVEIASNYYRKVAVRTVDGIRHSKLNASALHLESLDDGEVFISCLKAIT